MLKILFILLFFMNAVAVSPVLAADKATLSSANNIRIGVLTDLSGPMAPVSGKGSIEAVQMAVEDFIGRTPAPPSITVLTGDYMNRPDLAQHISEEWITKQNVDVVVDVPNASITSQLQDLFEKENKLIFTSCPSSGPRNLCSKSGLSWLYGQDIITDNLIASLLKEGKKRWFMISSAEAYSQNIATNATRQIEEGGAVVVGEAQLPPRMAGLKMVLEQIDPKNTDIIFLAFDHRDTMHMLRRWPKGLMPAPLALSSLHEKDIRTVPPFVQPIYIISPFYWEQNTPTRAWAVRFQERLGQPPSPIQASAYSAVSHYLQAASGAGKNNPQAILAFMKNHPLAEAPFGNSLIRADGVVMHPLHLLVSKPAKDRKDSWDYFKMVRNVPANEVRLPPQAVCDPLTP